MSKSIHNTGILSLNDRTWPKDAPKTVVVMGVSRSGTSMLVSLLEGLGVHMGDGKSFGSQEDAQIFKALEAENFDEQAFQKLVEEKTSKHTVWGWKRPESYKHLERFEHIIQNPAYIFTFRDILAISQRNHSVTGIDPVKALKANHKRYENILSILTRTDKPVLLVSYEKAVADKSYLALRVAEFLGIDLPVSQIPHVLEMIDNQKSQYNKSLSHIKKNQ